MVGLNLLPSYTRSKLHQFECISTEPVRIFAHIRAKHQIQDYTSLHFKKIKCVIAQKSVNN